MKEKLKRLFGNSNYTTTTEMHFKGVTPQELLKFAKDVGGEFRGARGTIILYKDGDVLGIEEINALIESYEEN